MTIPYCFVRVLCDGGGGVLPDLSISLKVGLKLQRAWSATTRAFNP